MTIPAPTSPPIRAWDDDDGRPAYQVTMFQTRPATSALSRTTSVCCGPRVTMPPIVSATAVATRIGPRMVKTVAMSTAGPGRAARVATSAAIEFDESWKPLDTSKASPTTITATSTAVISPVYQDWPDRRRRVGFDDL